MLKSRLAAGVAAGVMGIGVAGPLASADAATPTVVEAIKSAEHAFSTNKAFIYFTAHADKLKTKAAIKAALPRCRAVGKLYSDVSKYVAKSSASTSTQKTARTNWALGTALASHEYAALATEFSDLLAGNQAGAKASLSKALGYAKRASVAIDKADKLLGLPKGY